MRSSARSLLPGLSLSAHQLPRLLPHQFPSCSLGFPTSVLPKSRCCFLLNSTCIGAAPVQSLHPPAVLSVPQLVSSSVPRLHARALCFDNPFRMDAEDMKKAAKLYVDLSNDHKVPECLAMFASDGKYGSTTVGYHTGIEAITTMMTGFFEKFTAVNWQVESYDLSKEHENCVEFEFVRTGCFDAEGRKTRQEGKEWIHFTLDGGYLKIREVTVETRKNEVA
mmetsp:Transcript_21927/g.34343  ORF Transcript_21927/g.34343 Transcript_21927/m.34343 type:complete len:222 (+) Transcript_21927:90-755(+)